MKKIINLITIVLIGLLLTSCGQNVDNGKKNVVTTIFPIYDIVKYIGEDTINIDLMISPGQDVHSYDPSTQDIINVKKSDLLIYIGENMETWITNLNNESNNKLEIVSDERIILSSLEHHEEHHEHDHDVDMHIWTNPYYVLIMVELISKELININPEYKELYETNTNNYIKELKNIISDITSILEHKQRNTLYFGSPFAFYYFTTTFNLEHKSVYDTCSIEVEPTIDKIMNMNKDIIENNIPVVYTKELLNNSIAKKVIEGTNAKIVLLHSGHNVSSEDFNNGVTFLDIWKNNVLALREGLL